MISAVAFSREYCVCFDERVTYLIDPVINTHGVGLWMIDGYIIYRWERMNERMKER